VLGVKNRRELLECIDAADDPVLDSDERALLENACAFVR
jgi:hypothetical protein